MTRDYRERLRDARRSHPAVVFLGDSCAEFSSYPRLVAERLQTLAPAFDQVTKLNVPGWSSEQELVPLHHAYIDATRQAAAATNTSLCDAAAEADARGAARSTLLRADGIHFTSAGDGFMADVVSCCIQRLPP